MNASYRPARFSPQEILFAPTSACNLNCAHCAVRKDRRRLSPGAAIHFLKSAKKAGLERVGFTGGEPFLDAPFLFAVAAAAARNDLFFDRITTNAAWFKTPTHLRRTLEKLREAEYDGTFGVSVDAFHDGDLFKVALFLQTAAGIWDRPDVAQIVAIRGARDRATAARLRALARVLGAKIVTRYGRRFIKTEFLLLPLVMIDIVPVGKAGGLVDPWGKKWFNEDYCQGPGHVLYVLPDGSVKPCCGYATDSERLTIGNIHTDSAERILRKAARNPYVRAVFERGLSRIRGRLMAEGVTFPGKTDIHCFFCHHVLTVVKPAVLDRALRSLKP
jgi:hypothetical protein